MLELGSNRIRVRQKGLLGESGWSSSSYNQMFLCVVTVSQVIENLDALASLQSLFLGTNKITQLQNLDGLHNLTVLSIQVLWSHLSPDTVSLLNHKSLILLNIYLQSNRITKLEGLQNLISLKELYLSHNGIEVIEGLENNVSYGLYSVHCQTFDCFVRSHTFMPLCSQKKLTTLDIAANRIKRIENVGHLTELQEFWVCDIYLLTEMCSCVIRDLKHPFIPHKRLRWVLVRQH